MSYRLVVLNTCSLSVDLKSFHFIIFAFMETTMINRNTCGYVEKQMLNWRHYANLNVNVCHELNVLSFVFFFPTQQYYEMSYGLNIEMHKQVGKIVYYVLMC